MRLAPDAVAAVAVSATGERVPVPISGGNIAWTAPAGGDWTVMVVEHVFRTSPTRSDANPTHAKDASNSLEDYMNPEATAAYLEHTHQGYYNAMPELFGTTILGFRGDEPDYSIAGLPWTPKFFDTFQQVKGYDIRPYLGAILLSQGGGRARPPAASARAAAPQSDPAFIPAGPPTPPTKLTDAELRAKGDYYDVFSQMFRDGFFKPQGLWCAAHGVEYQVHLNHEEMEMESHAVGGRLPARHEVRRRAGDRCHLAPDMDRHGLGLSAAGVERGACVWASARVYRDLRGVPAGARCDHGALHPE